VVMEEQKRKEAEEEEKKKKRKRRCVPFWLLLILCCVGLLALIALIIAIARPIEGERGDRGREGRDGVPGPPGRSGDTSKYGFEWSLPIGSMYPFYTNPGLYAIANDPTYNPTPEYPFPIVDCQYDELCADPFSQSIIAAASLSYFVTSKNVTLKSVHLRGNTTYYDTFYDVQGPDGPYSIPLSLYVNSAFVAVLCYFPPANLSTFEVGFQVTVSGLSYPITTKDDMSFIVDLTNWTSGNMGLFMLDIGFQEDSMN
jgi:hypothetical protein